MGIGSDAWDRLFGAPRPRDLHPFREIRGSHHAVSTPGDLLFHIRATRMDLCFELATQIMKRLDGAVEVVDEVHGFSYFDDRDLIGFVDGTENPVDEDVALVLAEAKATEVSGLHPGLIFLGCEQVWSLDDEILHVPADIEEARRRLLLLSGRTHHVTVAVVMARGGEVLWRRTDVAGITMLKLDPGFIGRYMTEIGADGLQTANLCRIDGAGIQLVEKIEGDGFTAAGVPMLPLLAELRRIGAIDF